jgi:hypothetical protein
MSPVATPDITALMRRPGSGPPPMSWMTSRNGVPIITSPTPWWRTRPVTVHTMVPGDFSVPWVRNQAAPRAMMAGTLARVSTLSTSVGGAGESPSGPAISTGADSPLSETASDCVWTRSRTPRRNGGEIRGKGLRPAIASNRAVSSP